MTRFSNEASKVAPICSNRELNLNTWEFLQCCKRSISSLRSKKKETNKKTARKQHSVLLLSAPFADAATCQKRINPVLVVGQTARGWDASAFEKRRQRKKKRGSEKRSHWPNQLARFLFWLFAASLDSKLLTQCHCQPCFHPLLLHLH